MGRVDSNYIYLDWAATTPLSVEVWEAMEPFLNPSSEKYAHQGNANSLHSVGREAFFALEKARADIARSLGAKRPDEIIFTSGATEADNAAVLGIVEALWAKKRQQGRRDFVPHLIVSAIEHDAILAPARYLESKGVSVTYLRPDAGGFISEEALKEALTPETVLVSIMAANNEVGSIQPIAKLSRIAHTAGALFHSDMVQLLGKEHISLTDLGVDAASFSAHKVQGPKGVGVLYLSSKTPFAPQLMGGGQEMGRRSGTQQVHAAVGCAKALVEAQDHAEELAGRLRSLRDGAYAQLLNHPKISSPVSIEPGSRSYLPTHIPLLVEGFESETLVLQLDQQGIAVSGASACASHSLDPSHVLSAMGVPRKRALGSLRISLGAETTQEDVDTCVQALLDIVSA